MNYRNDHIISTKRSVISDDRGWFLKMVDGNEMGNPFACEVYVTSARPGESKGGHYHLVAKEWFMLIKGEALLSIVDVDSKEKNEILLSGTEPKTIYVPSGIAHQFKNVGTGDFILIAFTDQKYNPSDTIVYNFI